MLTAFDVGVGVLVLISAILATARGLTREVLSLATWAGAAAVAIYMYFNHREIAHGYIQEELIADAVTVIGSFLVALIILHLITMRIADFVVDSRIGPLDRTLGFVFGALRGGLIAVVVVIFGQWLLPGPQLPSWAAEARSLPVLEDAGHRLIAALPDDLEKQVTDFLQNRTGRSAADEEGGNETGDDPGTTDDGEVGVDPAAPPPPGA